MKVTNIWTLQSSMSMTHQPLPPPLSNLIPAYCDILLASTFCLLLIVVVMPPICLVMPCLQENFHDCDFVPVPATLSSCQSTVADEGLYVLVLTFESPASCDHDVLKSHQVHVSMLSSSLLTKHNQHLLFFYHRLTAADLCCL